MHKVKLKSTVKKAVLYFETGAGTLIYGTGMMIVCLFLFLMFTQLFLIHENAVDTQSVADAIADGVAIYMDGLSANDEYEKYNEAVQEAEHLKNLIEEETGIKVDNISIDREMMDEYSVIVVTAKHDISAVVKNAGIFHMEKTGATLYGVGNDYIRMALQAVGNPNLTYSQSTRNTWWQAGGDPRTTTPVQADCSSFVHGVLYATGNINRNPSEGGNALATPSLGQELLSSGWHQVAANSLADLKKGDVLNNPGSGSSGHARIYIGNGQCVEMTGSNNGVAVNNLGYYDNHYVVYRK